MTTVDIAFDRTWLTCLADPANPLTCWMADRKFTDELEGTFYATSNGGRIAQSGSDDSSTYPLTLQLLTNAQYALLKSWRGKTCLLRDSGGWREFGTFFKLDPTSRWAPDVPGNILNDVALTFTAMPYDEGV